MTKILRTFAMAAASLAAVALLTVEARADWEQVHELPNTYAHFITSEGVHLMSDYREDYNGGIYYSEDSLQTWNKTSVRDYTFSQFYEADGYVFALGMACRIARSEDGGRTWDLLNYRRAVEEYIGGTTADNTVCYAIAAHEGILYIGDFYGGGVLRSDDYGETWSSTDRKSLMISLQGDSIMENFYHLEVYNGKLYSFGLYSVHSYDAEADKWTAEPVNSNCMGVVTQLGGYMICGRAMPNDNYESEFLVVTDGEKWSSMPRPDTKDNNVRAIGNDGTTLYVMMHGGPMYYTDDFGQNWNTSYGLPGALFPLTVTADDDYVYSALYSPNVSDRQSGLWRISKASLAEMASINAVDADAAVTVAVGAAEIVLGSQADLIEIFDITGKPVTSAKAADRIAIASLASGAYIYKITCGTAVQTGKFLK